MHHKFVVIDRTVVLTGSANFTRSGMHGDANRPRTRGNVNHILRVQSDAFAELFRQEFGTMWGDGPGGKLNSRFGLQKESTGVRTAMVGATRVDVLFAPHRKGDLNHGLNWIEEQLDEARTSIDMALFVFTAQQLADALQGGCERWAADSTDCRSKLREPFIFRSARSSWRGSTGSQLQT